MFKLIFTQILRVYSSSIEEATLKISAAYADRNLDYEACTFRVEKYGDLKWAIFQWLFLRKLMSSIQNLSSCIARRLKFSEFTLLYHKSGSCKFQLATATASRSFIPNKYFLRTSNFGQRKMTKYFLSCLKTGLPVGVAGWNFHSLLFYTRGANPENFSPLALPESSFLRVEFF